MRVQRVIVLGIASVLLTSLTSWAAFTAYNDCVPFESTNPANTTGIGIGTNSVGSGVLKDFASGASTGVTLTVNNLNVGIDGTGPASAFSTGTDAAQTFAGKVDFQKRVIWYGSTGSWYVDMVFTGLDPAQTYDITTTMDRGDSTKPNRWTKISISDADGYTYAASAGAWQVGNDAVSISAFNTLTGYVAKWASIMPGTDGDFTIRYAPCQNTPGVDIPVGAIQGMTGSTPYGYGPGGFMLVQTPEPASLSLLLLGGLGLLRRRR